MKVKFNVKSNTVAAYCIIVFSVCLLLVAVVFKYNVMLYYLNKIITVLSPVIWGIVIAYIMNPIMKFVEDKLNRFVFKKKKFPKAVRFLSIAVAVILLLGAVTAIIGAIVPEIISTIKGLFMNISSYFNNLQDFLNGKISKFVKDNPKINEFINVEFNNIQDYVISAVNQYEPKLDSILDKNGFIANLTDSAWTFLKGVKNFALGIVVSIYLLYSKETLLAQAKKIVYALFSEKRRNHILSVSSNINHKFSRFISGKIVDCLIIGLICFIVMLIMDMKNYAVIISVIVGVTNFIPFFGPFIGGAISGLLILLTTPNKILIFIIFILLLQQFDGNILGPKILGDSLGLSPFWIIFAIFVGGGLFGFVGMVVTVPLFSVFYGVVSDIVAERLKRKRLPVETEYYKSGEISSEEIPAEETKDTTEGDEEEESYEDDDESEENKVESEVKEKK